jgi:hypothetical protein
MANGCFLCWPNSVEEFLAKKGFFPWGLKIIKDETVDLGSSFINTQALCHASNECLFQMCYYFLKPNEVTLRNNFMSTLKDINSRNKAQSTFLIVTNPGLDL